MANMLTSRNASTFVIFVLMATSGFVAPPAGGQTERYNSQGDLLAAISNPTSIGFDGIAPSGGYVQYVPITIDGVHFTDGVGTGYGCVLDSGQAEDCFLPHREIVTRLLEDREAKGLIEQAYHQRSGNQSQEWMANNMVAWFSQRITTGRSDWADAFERAKIDGRWAYKPVKQITGAMAQTSLAADKSSGL